MCHPWVTDEGRAPLRSCADLGLGSIEVTTQEQLGAIDRASVVSMIRARLKEKVFRSNEYLFQAVSCCAVVLLTVLGPACGDYAAPEGCLPLGLVPLFAWGSFQGIARNVADLAECLWCCRANR